MATVQNRVLFGIIPTPDRLRQRDSYGDVASMFESAIEEQTAGNIKNAKEMLRATLTLWLRQKWVECSGKYNTGITDPKVFIKKLRSGTHIDGWTQQVILIAAQVPSNSDSWLHLDLLRGVVESVCFSNSAVLQPCKKNHKKRSK